MVNMMSTNKDELKEAAKLIMKPYTITLLNLVSIILIVAAVAAALALVSAILGYIIVIAGALQLFVKMYERVVMGK